MKKKLSFIFLVLIFGMLIGTGLSMLISQILPPGNVVKEFFEATQAVGWGTADANWVHLGFLRFKTGLELEISFLSIIGFFISWYFLRYFK